MIKLSQILTVLFFFGAAAVYAQPGTASAAADAAVPAAGASGNPAALADGVPAASAPGMTAEELNKPFDESFFLTPLEIAAIQQALNGRVMKSQTLGNQTAPVIAAHRVIRVSGVLYRSPADWIVWMNNEKVTPDNLLPEIVDISVKPSSKVSLQWYDVGLNQVLSITLRPHQTYDITTGILLPQ